MAGALPGVLGREPCTAGGALASLQGDPNDDDSSTAIPQRKGTDQRDQITADPHVPFIDIRREFDASPELLFRAFQRSCIP